MKPFSLIVTQVILLFLAEMAVAQYPPAAGQEGSTAIPAGSPQFVAWATGCEVVRGPVDILDPDGERASFGDPSEAVGPAAGNSVNVVSLGDGGMATLTFDVLIADGEGWDFAVFENALNDTFLELAFVEVSSDGEFFVRFPAVSLTDTTTQVETFGELDCTKIHHLAGKYRQGYGTPFDLDELSGTPGLDVTQISHVRIVDAVGSLQAGVATYDSQGNAVNDPWPTPFSTGGFDLDGVGVINVSGTGISGPANQLKVFPNPFENDFTIDFATKQSQFLTLMGLDGKVILERNASGISTFDLTGCSPGIYLMNIYTDGGVKSFKMVKLK
jgi:hypothetical protein